MKSLIIVFGALLLIIATPFVFGAIDDARTTEYTQTFAGVTTGAGEYSENVTLSQALFSVTINSVVGITSNTTSDSPSASGYNSVSKALEVSGLDQSLTRTLSVEYKSDSATIGSGVSAFLTLIRWFYVFIIIGMAGGAIYAFFD